MVNSARADGVHGECVVATFERKLSMTLPQLPSLFLHGVSYVNEDCHFVVARGGDAVNGETANGYNDPARELSIVYRILALEPGVWSQSFLEAMAVPVPSMVSNKRGCKDTLCPVLAKQARKQTQDKKC